MHPWADLIFRLRSIACPNAVSTALVPWLVSWKPKWAVHAGTQCVAKAHLHQYGPKGCQQQQQEGNWEGGQPGETILVSKGLGDKRGKSPIWRSDAQSSGSDVETRLREKKDGAETVRDRLKAAVLLGEAALAEKLWQVKIRTTLFNCRNSKF